MSKITNEERARSDDAHIADKYVPKFGQLVERSFAKYFAERSKTLFIGKQIAVFVSFIRHTSELIKFKYPFFIRFWVYKPGAFLFENHRVAQIQPNEYSDDSHQPPNEDKRNRRKKNNTSKHFKNPNIIMKQRCKK